MKKKILICGASGFLMSTLIRYLIYRTKEYEIVGIDEVVDYGKAKRIYFHKYYRFHFCDIRKDYETLKTIIDYEDPDIIINGIYTPLIQECSSDIILPIENLIELSPDTWIINIVPLIEDDRLGYFSVASNKVVENRGTSIMVPHVFGRREDFTPYSLRRIITDIFDNDEIFEETIKIPWAFAEDLASLIWFIIKAEKTGLMEMPYLAKASPVEVAEIVKSEIKPNIKVSVKHTKTLKEYSYDTSIIREWKPDSRDFESMIKETCQWYSLNRWALVL